MNAEYSSFGSLLEDLRSLFPAALLGGSGWERLQPLANRLPACAADSRFGFEFHLSDPTPTGDFFVISSPHTGLAEFCRRLTEATAAELVGTEFTTFLDEQAHHSDSFLTRTGKGIILEYDLSRSPPGQYGVPGVFIVPSGYPEPDPVELYKDPAALVAALRSVAGWAPDVAESCHVEQACAALADCGVYVSHAGVMPGRAERAIRLVALGVDGAKVAEGLRRVQWPGDPSQAVAILSEFAGLVSPSCGLGISVTSQGVLPRLDLELTRKRTQGSPRSQPFLLDRTGWKLPIDRLVERGWCLPAKADGLREWPNLDMFFGQDGMYQVRQIINHFKVVLDRGAVYSKAYVAMDVRRTSQ
ncbi:MAG: hypothetical protein F4W93_00835 [Dehalococcoidia bacterium]|nr:hypothetical protein [Dehalococcoidia bacterium]